MITFGLTGGIATGKSTIAKTFVKHGIPVVDADQVAREVVFPGMPALMQITESFGHDFIKDSGELDRAKLGDLVFSDVYAMAKLNRIMRPIIEQEARRQYNKLHEQGHPLVCYDAALICEMGNADKYRPLVVAYCSPETQLERLMVRNGLTRQQAMDRIFSQMDPHEKAHMADQVIYTWGTIEDSIKQTETYIEILKSLVH